MNKIKIFLATAMAAGLLSGCDVQTKNSAPHEMPTVNDDNCKPENISKLDRSIQEEFSSSCLRRGSFKPSPPKSW